MLKNARLSVVLLLILILTGCSKEQKTTEQQVNYSTNYYDVFQISSPDELYQAMSKFITLDIMTLHIDDNIDVETENRLAVSYALGSQAANAALAEVTGSSKSEALIDSLKSLTETLNIRSESVEVLLVKLSDDMKLQDASQKKQVVRDDIKVLLNEIDKTLNIIGNVDEATMIKFGGWIEGLRIISSVLLAYYDADISSFLNRTAEVDYFLPLLTKIAKKSDDYPARFVLGLSKLGDVMKNIENGQYRVEDVVIINEVVLKIIEVAKLEEVTDEN